ncbi:MAG: hypothetical protein ABSF18_03290 [Gammaproteobacteria bacterium]|jgi:opacity protein-like surface antigen
MNLVNKLLLTSLVLMTSGLAFADEDDDTNEGEIFKAEMDEDGKLVLKKYVEPKREEPKLFYVAKVKDEDEEDEPTMLDGFVISLAGGIVSVDQEGSYDVTDDESGSLMQSNEGDWNHWSVALGVGYEFPLMLFEEEAEEDEISWIPAVTPQLNLYFIGGGDIEGEVYTWDPEVNAQSYTMGFDSTRLMLDVDLTIAAYQNISLYALAGIGVAWNSTSLTTVPHEGSDVYGVELPHYSNTSFAYEFGGGLDFTIDDDWAIFLEYMFTGLGDAEVRGTSVICTDCGGESVRYLDVEGSDIEVNAQTILLGLTYAL